jgi:hypothetical protein
MMGKRGKTGRGSRGEPEQFDEARGLEEEGVVEFDDSKAPVEDLAEVEEISEGPEVMSVPDGLFEARDALEKRMGGFDAVVGALAEPSERPSANWANIVGWGVGEKTVGGRHTGELAVKIYVVEKVAASEVQSECLAPEEIAGVPTDVEEVGEITALSFRGRYRPAPGGSSVAHTRVTAGTLGCLVVRNNNHLCMLSNNHVLANSNNAKSGDWILQPGPADGGRDPRDRVGILEYFERIAFGGVARNYVDAAVGWTAFRLCSPRHHCYRINTRPLAPRLLMPVRKCGRTTQHTLGIILGLGANIRVGYGSAGVALFTNQVVIRGIGRDFSAPGDSGSLVVSAGSRQPTALLFAGGGGYTIANPIQAVIREMGIRRFLN